MTDKQFEGNQNHLRRENNEEIQKNTENENKEIQTETNTDKIVNEEDKNLEISANDIATSHDSNVNNSDNKESDKNSKISFVNEEDELLRQFISSITGKRIEMPLMDSLRSGTILCEMVNKIINQSGEKFKNNEKFKNIRPISYSSAPSPFIQRENISKFISFCKEFIKPYELFETEDLFSQKNLQQVRIGLFALTRVLKYYKLIERCLGPEQFTDYDKKKETKTIRSTEPVFTFYEKNQQTEEFYSGRRQITLEIKEERKITHNNDNHKKNGNTQEGDLVKNKNEEDLKENETNSNKE